MADVAEIADVRMIQRRNGTAPHKTKMRLRYLGLSRAFSLLIELICMDIEYSLLFIYILHICFMNGALMECRGDEPNPQFLGVLL